MKSERPTLEDVAAEAGVSRSLASLALRDSSKVSPQRYKAIIAAVDKLNYRPNMLARNLAQRRSHLIGVVVNDLHNPFVAETMDVVCEIAGENKFEVFITTARRTITAELASIDTFVNHQADGVIVIGARSNHTSLAKKAAEVPLVAVGTNLKGVDTISNDDHYGAVLAVNHLLELGHTKIVHIGGGSGGGGAERSAGFLHAMEAAGLQGRIFEAEFSEKAAIEAMKKMSVEGDIPSAIFCGNDYMAEAALDYLAAIPLSVPEDVSVIGYDNSALAARQNINLTSVNQPIAQMAETATLRLIDRINGFKGSTRSEIVEPSLVIRKTTGTYQPSR